MTISPISFLYWTPTTFRSRSQQTHISLRYQISQLKWGICMRCKICQSIRNMECNRGSTYRLGSLREDNSSPSSPSSPSFSLSLNSRWRTWKRVSKSSVLPSCPVLKSVMKSSPVDKRTSIILLFICIFQLGKEGGREWGRERERGETYLFRGWKLALTTLESNLIVLILCKHPIPFVNRPARSHTMTFQSLEDVNT